MSVNYFKYLWALMICVFFVSVQAHSQDMWGTGYYQGGMVCPYQTNVARNAVNVSDDEKEARRNIKKLEVDLKVIVADKTRIQSEVEILREKIDTYFESEVVEFLLDVHIDQARKCDDYQSIQNRCIKESGSTDTTKPTVDCDAKLEVPEPLQKNWTSDNGAYCKNSGGLEVAAICDNESLRAKDYRGKFRPSECTKNIAEYRRQKNLLEKTVEKEEDKSEEIRIKETAISDTRRRAEIEREYRLATETEAEDCPDGSCDAYSRGSSGPKLKRDLVSTTAHVVGGIVNFAIGQRADRIAREEAAQYGVPSGGSYGYAYYQAGLYGVINGLVGPGAYGCSSSYAGGGFQNGLNGPIGNGNGMFGPFGANGGAFSYPQAMYGSPWGGGAYNPGLNQYGGFNGPFGGTGAYGQQFPGNGNMAMCFTWPCNTGGGGPQIGGQIGGYNPYGVGGYNPYSQSPFGGQPGFPQIGGQIGFPGGNPFGFPQIGGQIGGQIGFPGGVGGYNPYSQSPFANQMGMNGQLSMQYQMQMMQMQQQMQQQMQYYQAQMQAQMQYQQQTQQRQQQAYQIQQQISQLNMQLQSLYYQNNLGGAGGLSLGGSINFGVGVGGGFSGGVGGIPMPTGFPSTNGYSGGYIPGYNTPTTNPGTTTDGTRGR